ncbi:hypothetical protein L7F22_061486 [Adiantum nelumboides]|nr:hypothetical protein [Adiantum nelumboides]
MVVSQSIPASEKLLDTSCASGNVAPISTPSKHAQLCHSESNSASNRQYKALPTASHSLGRWHIHYLNAPPCKAAVPPPCSPPESENSSSTFSIFGSASSLSFNDTCSYNGVLGELSPSSVGSKDPKSGMVSPVRLSFQDMQLSSKLHTFGYNITAHTTPQKLISIGQLSDDRFLEFSLEGRRAVKRPALIDGYSDCNSAQMGSTRQHYDREDYESRGRQQRGSFVGEHHHPIIQVPFASTKTTSFSTKGDDPYCTLRAKPVGCSKEPTQVTSASEAYNVINFCGEKNIFYSELLCSDGLKKVISSERCTDYGNTLKKNGIDRQKTDDVNVHLKENSCMLNKNGGLLEQTSIPTGGLPKTSEKCGRHSWTCVDSCTDGYRNTNKYVKHFLECGVSPYDTEIDIDVAAFKHLPDLMIPQKEVSLSRALSLHQSPYSYGRPPLVPTPKLNNTPCSPGSKEVLQRRSFTGCSPNANGSPTQRSKRRQIKDGADASFLKTRDLSKTRSSAHFNADADEIADGLSIGPGQIDCTHNSYVEHLSASSFLPVIKKNAEKRPPLILSGAKHDGELTTESPTTLSSMAHRDWRSRSLGERASLKSTARNLEAAFAGFKTASLHKSSSCISKDVSKQTAQVGDLMDTISVSSNDGLKDQPCQLVSSDGSLDRKWHFNGDMVPCNAVLSRKPASSSTEMLTIACTSKSVVIKPSAPIAQKRRRPKFELLCKPLLPVAQSIYLLPSSKGALHSEKPCSSGYNLQWLSSDTPKVTSPVMLQATVQCTSTDGLSCFTMSIEGAEEMLMAKDCRPQTLSSTAGPKWRYTFYSGKVAGKGPRAGGWRRWMKRGNKAALDLIGIMQVSNVYKSDDLLAVPVRDWSLSLEFALYDGKAHTATHSQSLRICPKDMSSHKTSILDTSAEGMQSSSHCMIPSRLSLSHQGNTATELTSLSIARGANATNGSGTLRVSTSPLKGHARHRPTYSLDGCSDSDFTESDSHVHDPSLLSHMELAAIVIRPSMKSQQSMLNVVDDVDDTGGWGLKFLNRGTDVDKGHRESHGVSLNVCTKDKSSTSMESAQWPYKEQKTLLDSSSRYASSYRAESTIMIDNLKTGDSDMEVDAGAVKGNALNHEKTGLSDCITVILPLGDHSLPIGGVKRPSSLIERWETGGSCECGGWDLGCGIEVLSSEEAGATSQTNTSSVVSHDQPISILSKGSRKELMFSLSLVKEGQYTLKFHEKLSQLRAFATAVAVLHCRQTASISSTSTSTSTSTPTSTSMMSSALSSS